MITPILLAAALQAAVPYYSDLGNNHLGIGTRSPEAQRYFDQGLRLVYGFNHAEAIRSFREAQRLDPACAMCYWGEALAFGPNINAPMDSASGVAAYAAVQRALALAARAPAKDRAYINALAQRFGRDPYAQSARRDTLYARAMQQLAAKFPRDNDAQTLAADAQMNLSPWNYWVKKSPRPNAVLALANLERVIARAPNHAGACHFFIHAVEAAFPERAVPCADRLPSLMPGAGHIVHMPAHIYARVGRYADAIANNEHAVHADEQVIADMPSDGAYRLAYYPHNYHFLWFAATMAGNSDIALKAAYKTAEKTNKELLQVPGLGALQHYLVTPLFAQVRFGKWNDVLAFAEPAAELPYMRAVRHYARAIAYSATKDFGAAEKEIALLQKEGQKKEARELSIWGFNSGAGVLDIALHAARGELAFARNDLVAAIAELRQGIAKEDALGYDEPPTWHLPLRQQLGVVLMKAGQHADAERAFSEDLERHPENGWSLRGLADALRAQGKESSAVEARFKKAWRKADVQL